MCRTFFFFLIIYFLFFGSFGLKLVRGERERERERSAGLGVGLVRVGFVFALMVWISDLGWAGKFKDGGGLETNLEAKVGRKKRRRCAAEIVRRCGKKGVGWITWRIGGKRVWRRDVG